jgi:CHAD domain-containing protein
MRLGCPPSSPPCRSEAQFHHARAQQLPAARHPIRLDGSLVLVSLLAGKARAPGRAATAPLLEFRLVMGSTSTLFKLARSWVERFDLRLDLQAWLPHAEFPQAESAWAARSDLRTSMPAQQALQALVKEVLHQLLPHLAHLAHASHEPLLFAKPEPLHGFASPFRCAAWLLGDHAAGWNPAWEVALRDLFVASGMARDQQVLKASLLPALRALQAPLVDLPAPVQPAPLAPLLQSPEVSLLVLDLLEFGHTLAPASRSVGVLEPAEDQSLMDLAGTTLKALRRRVLRDVRQLTELEDARVHSLRKRLKRLRYSLDFLAPLLPERTTRHYLAGLQRTQDALGAWHDMTVAEALYRQAAGTDPRAWFAVGWTVARKAALREEAGLHLRHLVRLKSPW